MRTRFFFRADRAGRLLLLGALALIAGCEHGFFADAPRLPAGVHVVYDLSPAARAAAAQIGGPDAAFDKVTSARISWNLPSETVHDTTVTFTPDAEVTVSLSIPMRSSRAELQLSLALFSGADSIFTGAATADLQAGQTTQAEVALNPVAARLSLGDSITMTALGDTIPLGGNVVFATGDIIPDRSITWTSSDTSVVTVVDGAVVSHKEGQAQLHATSGTLTGTRDVRVAAVVDTIHISPDGGTVEVGRTLQLGATAVDRRGNALVRTISWASSPEEVATVDGTGLVTGVSRGSATVTASAGGQSGSASITVIEPTGNIAGVVANATNTAPISGATIALTDTLGAAVAAPPSIVTDAAGHFQITGVRAGVYRITASAEGFVADTETITVLSGQTTSVSFALSPHLGAGQTRIVLTWGALPTDLDSHLIGPDGSGGTFHIAYYNRGSETSPPYAQLDLDDTSGYGPETTTIFNQLPGSYCFYVDKYSNNGTLPESSAQVKVYQGDALVATFNTPTTDGRDWTVFTLNGDTITTINTVGAGPSCPAVPAAMRVQLQARPRKLK
jgi:hypothetical protein